MSTKALTEAVRNGILLPSISVTLLEPALATCAALLCLPSQPVPGAAGLSAACVGQLTCSFHSQVPHVLGQLAHADGGGLSLDVMDSVPPASPVAGNEVGVGAGLYLHCISIHLQNAAEKTQL